MTRRIRTCFVLGLCLLLMDIVWWFFSQPGPGEIDATRPLGWRSSLVGNLLVLRILILPFLGFPLTVGSLVAHWIVSRRKRAGTSANSIALGFGPDGPLP